MDWTIKAVGERAQVGRDVMDAKWPGHVDDATGQRAFEYARTTILALLLGFPTEQNMAKVNVRGSDGTITHFVAVCSKETIVSPIAPEPDQE